MSNPPLVPPRVLTIAASDSSGAAGLQADLKTFAARRVFGLAALTAVTAQDSARIHEIQFLPAAFVAAQIRACLGELTIAAIKTGLLLQAEVVLAVAETLAQTQYNGPLVVDPVLVAGDGRRLANDAAIEAYRDHLFPRATLITPNIEEAQILTGLPIEDADQMRGAAMRLSQSVGGGGVLIKGGHLAASATIVDGLYWQGEWQLLQTPRLAINNPRGAGCTFSACIAAEIGKGLALLQAVVEAQAFVGRALAAAAHWPLGQTARGLLWHSVDINDL
jgi:hydroxymethylpyrimidine/phosphomethylpyrimidine kinase